MKKIKKNPLVSINTINNAIRFDLRYASTNNFVGKKLYEKATAYLLLSVAQKLSAVQKELEKSGRGVLVWDAYRPYPVQKILWDLVPDERYVAHPQKGSAHNRGIAVDLTLVDEKGRRCAMPTDFDDFSTKAHYSSTDLPKEVLENRSLLKALMQKHGFEALPTEWWHFSDAELTDSPLLSVSFTELADSF